MKHLNLLLIFLFFTIMIPQGTARPLLSVPPASGDSLLVQQNVNAAGPVPVLIAAGFNQPVGLALDSAGSIYVLEDAGQSIKMIQHYPNGSFNPTVGVVSNTPSYNIGFASDQANNLYFGSYWGGYVDELPVGCQSISCIRTLVNDVADGPRGVGVDSHGYVWYLTRWGGGDDNGTLRIYFPDNASNKVLLDRQNYPNLMSIGPDDCAYWGVMNSGVASDHVPEVRRYCLGMTTYQTIYTFTTQCINGVSGACPEMPFSVRADSAGDVFWSTWGVGRIMMLSNSSTTPTVILDYRTVDPTVEPEIGDIILDGSGNLYYIIYDVYPVGTISLSPSDGPAGTSVTVTGTNFPTGDTTCVINSIPSIPPIFAVSPAPTCSISNGNVAASFTVASGAAPGNYTIEVTGIIPGVSGIDGYATFIVDAASSSPSLGAPRRGAILVSPKTLTTPTGFSVNGIKLPKLSKPKLIVTPQMPANGTLITGTPQTLTVKVTSNPPSTPVTGANVTIYVNGAPICTNQSSPSTGLVSCPYEVTAQGTYRWNGTAQKPGTFDPAVAPQPTFIFTAGPIEPISLVAGWNLISIPLVPSTPLITKVLAAQIAANDFTIIWSYQRGKWSSATLSKGKLSGSLTSIADGFGYWIFMTEADTLSVTGSVFAPPPALPPAYTLTTGWNLVGFKPEPTVVPEQVDQYLTSITGSYDTSNVWVYDNTSQSWIRANSSYALQPGQALWILVTSASGATLRP